MKTAAHILWTISIIASLLFLFNEMFIGLVVFLLLAWVCVLWVKHLKQ